MPLFDFECPKCGAIEEHVVRFDVTGRPCDACGSPTRRLMGLPVVFADSLDPYYDHGLGTTVTSRTQKRNIMAEKSLAPSDKKLSPHGTKGTIFSFAGQAATSVAPSGFYAKRHAHGLL
jgi:putative FmdB family regulatory protein